MRTQIRGCGLEKVGGGQKSQTLTTTTKPSSPPPSSLVITWPTRNTTTTTIHTYILHLHHRPITISKRFIYIFIDLRIFLFILFTHILRRYTFGNETAIFLVFLFYTTFSLSSRYLPSFGVPLPPPSEHDVTIIMIIIVFKLREGNYEQRERLVEEEGCHVI
ncbi:hypothetical protein F4775DRAFT_410591 [Biscogniauxia sp. FL1348]|nr:hypothetical protein F4775DRAFT_410591 [Biscogniauxia sp. FL1348]